MTYEETIELEKNIKYKNKADELYKKFKTGLVLNLKTYQGNGKFIHWSDSHNSTFIVLGEENCRVEFRFLHQSYDFTVSPSMLFHYLHNETRGFNYLENLIKNL